VAFRSALRKLLPGASLVAAATLDASPANAAGAPDAVELSSGVSMLLVLGPVSGTASPAVEAAVHGPIARRFRWAGGVRLGLSPVSPEAFGRFSVAPGDGSWRPTAGIELGIGGRASADGGDALLSELRAQSREHLSPVYAAIHAAPLRFVLSERWRLSVLETELGTQLTPFGRFVRAELAFVSVGFIP
jgi:hypothetical protein